MNHLEEKHVDVPVPPLKHVFIEHEKFKALKERRRKNLKHRAVQHLASLPAVDTHLEQYRPVAYNQGQLGSCTANAYCHYLKMLDPNRGTAAAFEPSRNFVYSCELTMENPGKKLTDLGANVSDACTLGHSVGICPEADYPYLMNPTTEKITNALQPVTQKMITDAAAHKYPAGTDVTNNGPLLNTIQTLISQDTPVLVAWNVYSEFESPAITANGILTMPTAAELAKQALGGHETLCIGYDSQYLHFLNSYGPQWGGPYQGMFMMPIQYLTTTGANGPLVDQLIAIAPVPISVVPPTPVPPGPTPVPPDPTPVLNVAQLRAELANAIAQLTMIDSQLAASQPVAKKSKTSE
jgi:uncharacterized protein YvpB